MTKDEEAIAAMSAAITAIVATMVAAVDDALGEHRRAWQLRYRSARVTGRLIDHTTHGRDTAEDYPNASACPCASHRPAIEPVQRACAAAGCRYCAIGRDPQGRMTWWM